MEAEAAKFIGAGLACLGMAGAGIGSQTSSLVSRLQKLWVSSHCSSLFYFSLLFKTKISKKVSQC